MTDHLVPAFPPDLDGFEIFFTTSENTSQPLPLARGGNLPITYSVSPALPDWLTLTEGTNFLTLSGTPTEAFARTEFTLTARDVDGDTDTASIFIFYGIDTEPTFGDQTIADQVFIQNVEIATLTFPEASGGNQPLRYVLTIPHPGILPAGLSQDGLEMTGTPTGTYEEATWAWSAIDVDGDGSNELRFTVTIEADVQPNFTDISVADQSFTQNTAITDLVLPEANSGNAPVTYELTPALPAGLTLTGRTISGTPTGTLAETEFTWTATDANDDTAELTFDITIAADNLVPTFGSASVTDKVYRVGSQISPVFLPTATGGDGSLTHTLSPALPTGLSLVGGTVIFGTPTEAVAGTEYTWTATDTDDDTASITFDITVEEDMVTSFGDKTVDAQTLIVGEAFTLTLPEVNVGDHPITYTLRPGIPPPLTLVGRTISGTPIATFRTITQTWTATDEDDDTASLTFDFTVEADVSPNFTDISVADQSYRQGVAIADLTLPAANSGNAPLTYALTPALPAGLMLTDGVISGTPTGSLVETEFTWTATDANDDEAELTFDITIAANLAPSFAGESVDDQAYISGVAIDPLTLPAAASGDAPVVYSLSPALPNGMTRTGFRVSGTPSAAVAETEYTWTATDADDDADSLTFNITVAADLQPNFTGLSVADQSFVEDIAITAFTLPDAASGNAPLSYELSPALPVGLALTGRTVSGTPTAALTETEYTWEVTDANDDTASLTFDITVAANVDPDFGSSSVSNKTYITGQAIPQFTLPTAGSGNPPLMYALSPALPTGISQTGRVVSGTPTGTLATTEYTWTVTDVHGDTDSITFFLAVVADTNPSFSGLSIADMTFIEDSAITAFALPRANGGNVPVSHALTPALPAGLALVNSVIQGTPTAAASATTYTWTAEDADGDTDSLTFDITVEADVQPTFGMQTIADQSFIEGAAITNVTLPAATSGNAPVAYSISPALPTGLSISAARVLSGTPDNGLAETEFTWTAMDADGDTDSLTFSITIAGDLRPTFGAASVADKSYIAGSAITSFTLPAATSGNDPVALSLTPALPNGLSRNGRVVSGTPTAAMAATTYTWTATDVDNDTASLTFDITVVADLAPRLGSLAVADQTYRVGTAISRLRMPGASGGNTPRAFSLTPALPAGLTRSGRDITGTPTEAVAETEYTWTVTDVDGDTDSITFSITVEADLMPTFGASTVTDKTYRAGSAITAFDLPAATSGNAPVSYTLSPALPSGMSRSGFTISGTPAAAVAATTYTWEAEDDDGDTASLTFDITVAADLMPSFGASTVSDKSYIQNSAITAFTLPLASGGDTPLSYELTPALPMGLSRTGRVVSGTPSVALAETEYTWTAEDDDGDTASITFDITVAADLTPTFGASSVSDKEYIQNSAIAGFVLPAATSGNAPISYTLTPALPAGISRSVRTVSGTPTGTLAATTYTWTAEDVDGDTASLTFDITVAADVDPTFGSSSVANKTYVVGFPIDQLDLPAATSGNAPLMYALSPALPDGLTLTGQAISGTPTAMTAPIEYTWTVTDADGDTDSITFFLIINADTEPSFADVSVDDQTFIQDVAITSFDLPAATGGNQIVTYALTPALPAGLTLTGQTISGTPTGTLATTEYTWTATDADDDTASLTFDITIEADTQPGFLDESLVADQLWTIGTPAGIQLPDDDVGGNAPLTYTLTPALPAGMSRSEFLVSGTPAAALSETEYTWTVTDANGDMASLTFDITVVAPPDLMPFFGNQSVDDQSFIQNSAITNITLPAASSGDAPLSYTLTPTLPAGLTRTGFIISGTPTGTLAETEYTWTVADADNDSASLTFDITVVADLTPTFGAATVSNKSYIVDSAITNFTLPAASSGNAPVTHSLAPTLPTGLSLNGRVVSGTPTAALARTTYIWTATDVDGDTDSISFSIAVAADSMPSLGGATVDDMTYIAGSAITLFRLPNHTGGNAPVTRSLTPALPTGLSRSGRRITGTPTAAMAETEYTWTVTDTDGDSDSVTFNITVVADLMPTFGLATVSDKDYIVDSAITAFTLPTASGGNAPLSYSLNKDLPDGLTLTGRTISGTPTTVEATGEWTWTAEDADGDTASLTFTINVAADLTPTFGASSVTDKTYVAASAIDTITLPSATSGNAPLSYELTPALPTGLSRSGFDIDGTPTETTAATTYTWTAEDIDGDTDSITFDITIVADAVPTFGMSTVANQTYRVGSAIDRLTLPASTGGNAPVMHMLTPELPAGLTLSGRNIDGTPTEAVATTTYTWTAEDADGDTNSITFRITVEADLMPTFGASSVTDKTYRVGSAITSFTLPVATSGDAPVAYSLSPALPNGLSRTGRVISGTPTATQAATTYTWTATDEDDDTADLTFDITVEADLMPTFGASVADRSYIQNSAITAFTLPAATSGNTPVVLSLSPALPAGLTRTGRRISGTPTGTQAATTYTWTATDDDGDTATLTFDITVVADLMPNFTGSSIADQSFINGEVATAFTLPTASSGNAPLSYSISPGLPNGLTLTGRTVSGTPLVTLDETTYTWTAEDIDGDTAALTFSITIAPPLDLMPTFGSSSVTNKEYMQGVAITAFALPAATSGDAPLRYSISPALPTGITLTGRRVSGTPTGSLAQTTYTWTATDADDDTASLTFDITVIADTTPTFGAGTVFNKSYIAGSAIAGFALPGATSGNAPLSYTLTPALPSGITRSGFDVTGTPSAAFTETEYTWTVEDADGDTDTITFDIEVVADTQPTFGAQSIAAQSYVRNVEIATLRLPVATGGNVVNRYSISPGLPAGLSIDSDRLELSGTPTASLVQTEFTWTATDFDGDTASLRFTIAVADAPANLIPTFGAASVANKTYRVGTTIPQFTLPTASSGNAPLSYTLTPALPAGINLSGRVVSGTPGRETAATTYTWTVTDADNDTGTITFSIAVEASAGPPPDPASNWRAPRTWQGKDGEEELADKLGEWDAAQSYGQKSAYNPTEDIYDLTFEWSEPLNETMPAIARSAGQIFVGVGRNRLRAMAAGNGGSNYAYMSNGTDIVFASLQGLIDAAFPTMRQGDLVVVGGTSGEVVAFPTPFDRNPPYILQLMNGDVYWRAVDGDVQSSSRPL